MFDCRLEIFPIEILYQIFDYLWLNEIYHGIFNINPYLDNAIRNYDPLKINFHQCHRQDFDQICSSIQSNRIRSLILSNHDQTPEQFQLFFSKFSLEQLTHLYALTLIDIEKNVLFQFMNLLNNDFNSCPCLQSLKIYSNLYSYSELFTNYTFSRPLKQLQINRINRLNISKLVHLRQLTIHRCSLSQFREILQLIPTLKSLQITNFTSNRDLWIPIYPVPMQLKRLVLNMLDIDISLYYLADFLTRFRNLRHLELQIIGDLLDLCDGYRWAIISKDYQTFDFNFTAENTTILCPHLLIDTFRWTFWLETKSWLVAYDHSPSRIFTLPRFADRSASFNEHDSFQIPKHSNIPPTKSSIFSNCITHLTVARPLSTSVYFTHVKTLSVIDFQFIQQLESIVDLTQVTSLKIDNVCDFHELEQLISNVMIHVNELHLRTLPIENKNSLTNNSLKSIHRLHIRTCGSIDQLYRQFSSIEFLHIECAQTYVQLRTILKYFRRSLSFLTLTWSLDKQNQRAFDSTLHWIEKQSIHSNFTYRYHKQHLPTIHLWIQSKSQDVYLNRIIILQKKNLNSFCFYL